MHRLASLFRAEERQYVPFVAGAIISGLIIGFPLGLVLAHAAAQGSNLGGRWAALAQAHGHLQLLGWLGLFVMGMGFRLVPRFTGTRIRPAGLVPVTFCLMVAGLLLRTIAQPFADEGPIAALFVASAVLEVAASLLFAAAILRCLTAGRREAFLYSPFFGAGAVWLSLAALLNLAFVVDAATDSAPVIPALRSLAAASALLYGFVVMFILAVSLRIFPIFFQRPPAQRQATLIAWSVVNGALAVYVASIIWRSYDLSADTRVLQTAAFFILGVALIGVVGLIRIFEGQPHRLHSSSRRSMRFVRSAYAWLLVTAALQTFFAGRALIDGNVTAFYETDAIRHFLALGFMTPMIIGMAFLVLPRLAMLRGQGQSAGLVAPLLLILLHGAAAARGAGSLLANEAHLESGFWTMTGGGLAGILAMGLFVGYLLRRPKPPDVPLSQV